MLEKTTKTQHLNIGRYGEDMACAFLKRRFYKIIERNTKLGYKEIDIIAKKGSLYVFVEVKTLMENKYLVAEDMINSKKIANLKQFLLNYINIHQISLRNTRIDFMAVNIEKNNNKLRIKHYKNIA